MELIFKKSRAKVEILSVAIIFGLILLSLLSLNVIFIKENKKNILRSIQNISELVNVSINKEIKTRFDDLNITAKYITDKDLVNPQDKLNELKGLVEKNSFEKIAITLPDGTSYVSTGDVINVSDREYFKKSMNGENYLSNVIYSKLTAREVNVYSVPILMNDEVIGVLWASVDMGNFHKIMTLEKSSDFDESYLIDSSGNLVSQSNTKKVDQNFFDFISSTGEVNANSLKKMKKDFNTVHDNYQLFKYKNQNVYMYYSKLNYNDWWLLNKIPVEKVNSNSYMLAFSIFITIGLIFMLIAAFTILYYRHKKRNDLFKNVVFTDDVTDGKNYIYLKSNIKDIINKKGNFAFVSLKLKKIKHIISLLGDKNIELLLKEIYSYLSKNLSEDEIIVHSHDGEYILILKYNELSELIERIENINLNKIYKNIDYKIGIYLIDTIDIELEEMSSYANFAMDNINDNAKYAIYTEEVHKKELNYIKLEEDIKQGISNNEFKAWFQPKYGKDGKTITSAEALVRWYKYNSVISPYVFIPICENAGLIQYIDKLVLEDVCKNLRLWIDENKKVVPISVNLSRAYLDKENCIDQLEEIISKYNIPTELIQFEVTESSLVDNEENLKETIEALHKKGFKILLDDFGVGYSSIKTISDMNFDTLKIDKSFVDGIGEKRWDYIIDYTIHLSKKLNMDVTAEGIETEEQYKFLLNCDCTSFQGYYFNKPMDSTSFTKLL